jgi:bifunctional UDP-N-acetylglucosamine pyrophosphorylase/glucosamine-1-phosphate N-acetyltransferase
VTTVSESRRPKLAAVVMAGGRGTRMRSATPKHLHPILGRRMVDWIVEAARPLGAEALLVVVSPETADAFEGLSVAVQEQPLGTGDAVRAAEAALAGSDEVLVLSGDTPLLTSELLAALLETHRVNDAAATVLSFVPADIRSYGRIVRTADGDLESIVEAADATPEQLEIGEANSSIYVFRADLLWPALHRLQPANAQGELYLTDAVRDLVGSGHRVVVHVAPDPAETEGVNTRVELAAAAAALRDRINAAHMLAGVTLDDPATTWIEPTVALAADTTVHPFTVLRGATSVAEGAEVGPHAVVVDAEIGPAATVGPFCYVRPGTVLGARAKAGTFVEMKNTQLGEGAKVPHLSYFGDAEVGAGTNIGAGSITANFGHRPGEPKKRTVIGRDGRVAVDTMFVAPVTVGDDVWTAAGTVVTEDVPDNALVGFPPRQTIKEGRGGKRDS